MIKDFNWYLFVTILGEIEPLPTKPAGALITWKYVLAKIPWGLIFLLGKNNINN